MKRNASEVEQRLLLLLRKNSRISILDASRELGVSRITAKKAFDALVDEEKIRNFTITLNEDMKDLVLVHVKDLDNIPLEYIVEQFSLIDGTFIVVLYYENLVRIKNKEIMDVKFASSRTLNVSAGRLVNIHCDYCGKEIKESPILVEIKGRTNYACCPNCERDMKKRREIVSELGD